MISQYIAAFTVGVIIWVLAFGIPMYIVRKSIKDNEENNEVRD